MYDDTASKGDSSGSFKVEGDNVSTSSDKKDAEAMVDVRPVGVPVSAPASREVLQAVFKRAAWYSLAFALVVLIIGKPKRAVR